MRRKLQDFFGNFSLNQNSFENFCSYFPEKLVRYKFLATDISSILSSALGSKQTTYY